MQFIMKAKRCCALLLTLFWLDTVTSRRTYSEGDIRLIGGSRRYMGTVLIYHDNKWGAICDDQWGMNDAEVACKQLGYTFALRATTRSEFGQGRKRMWMSQMRCRGSEERLADCVFQGYDRFTKYRCPGPYRSAGVICSAALPSAMAMTSLPSISTGPIRPLQRRLIARRRWWRRNRQRQTTASPTTTTTTTETTSTTTPTTTSTTTTEATTTTTTTTTTIPSSTTTSAATTTTEATTTSLPTTKKTIPIVSSGQDAKNVEELKLLNLDDKTVAQPVSLNEEKTEIFSNDKIDEISDEEHYETSLDSENIDDTNNEILTENEEDYEIQNSENIDEADDEILTENDNDLLGEEEYENEKEISESNDKNLSEEDDENSLEESNENLTQNNEEELTKIDKENTSSKDENSEEFVIDNSEDENQSSQNISYGEDFMKNDSPQLIDDTLQSPPETMVALKKEMKSANKYLADAPPVPENVEIKLEGGRYKWEGHLQVKINGGSWGTICSDHWTLREVMVACNQLKDLGKAKQALLTDYFGGGDMPKVLHRIQCVGRETSLSECKLTKIDEQHTCSKKNAVAGVVCSEHLPDLIPNLRAVEDSVRLQDQPLYYLRCSMEENCLANSAYVIKNTSLTWRNEMRRLLRFSTVVHNRGTFDFRPYLPRGQWQWHACHMHYHSMEVFAHYDILDSNGTRLAEGSKASFCLEDSACDNGVHPKYNCRGFADQGLSVNCSDNYMYDIDCQWIDISDIKPGDYTFLMEVNPSMLVAESDFDNNVVSCHLNYNGYFASLKRCHYESLLDHRLPMKIPA